jgi:hypothetical protein
VVTSFTNVTAGSTTERDQPALRVTASVIVTPSTAPRTRPAERNLSAGTDHLSLIRERATEGNLLSWCPHRAGVPVVFLVRTSTTQIHVWPRASASATYATPSALHVSSRCGSDVTTARSSRRATSTSTQSARLTARVRRW